MEANHKAPRVCFGMTLHNKAEYLPTAMESLLGQTHSDFTIVAVDDASTDGTEALMREYAEKDSRVRYFRNPSWQGMINTWRTVVFKSLEVCRPEFFAWASDHDVWHPEWLKRHIDTMLSNRDAVLVYPQTSHIGPTGEPLPTPSVEPFDTYDDDSMRHLYRVSSRFGSAGYAVYGLFRMESLLKAGVFRRVLLPDRLLLTEISAYGRIRQIPETLWMRRLFNNEPSEEEMFNRQRAILFGPGGSPPQAAFPFLSHVLSILFNICIFPLDGDRSYFSKGLTLAGLMWERRRRRIRNELDLLSEQISNAAPRGNTLDGIGESDIGTLTRELEKIFASDPARPMRAVEKAVLEQHHIAGLAAAALSMNKGFAETTLMQLRLSESGQYIHQLQRDREQLEKQNRSLSMRLLDAKKKKNDFESKINELRESEARVRKTFKSEMKLRN